MEFQLKSGAFNIIGRSEAFQKSIEIAKKAADSDSTVIVFGESGTGKELIARVLHHNSPREKNAFVSVNCAAIPHDLLESELFGYEKGSFTGAIQTRVGRLELANKGTIFLDEIGDMPPALQVKLLRFLAEREIDRIGGVKSIPIDVRVIAATNRDLEKDIQSGKFREDLYYRLNVIPVHLPPLRQRKSDVPLLVAHFLDFFNKKRNKAIQGIDAAAMEILANYTWPGNIRELANYVERMLVLSNGMTIGVRDLPEKVLGEAPEEMLKNAAPASDSESYSESYSEENPFEALRTSMKNSFFMGVPDEGLNLKQTVENFERELIEEALEKTDWVKNKAAQLLSLNRTTLVEKLKKLKITRPA